MAKNTNSLQNSIVNIDPLNINSFSNDDIKIFFSDQNDKILIDNADSIPHNSIIFSSNSNGNSILCKDDTKVRSFLYKKDFDWFTINSDNKITINESKLKEKVNEYINEKINSFDINEIKDINDYIVNIVNDILANYDFPSQHESSENNQQLFPISDWYDYELHKIEPVSTNPLIYNSNSGDGIYSKPVYLNPGKYNLVIYVDNSNIPQNDYYLYYYGNLYPKDLGATDPINIQLINNNSSKIIKINKTSYYEWSVNLNITNSGFYSFNIFSNNYNLLII